MRKTMLSLTLMAALIAPLYAHHGSAFLTQAQEMNTSEVRLADLAINKAQNAHVKEFAQMLKKDHSAALEKIKQLRDARLADSASNVNDRTLKNTADVQITPEHQRTLDRLSLLSGATFDAEFIKLMVGNHRNGVRMFEAQTKVHGNASACEELDRTQRGP